MMELCKSDKTVTLSMKLLSVLLMCCMCLVCVPAENAEAAANGIYLATAAPHYRHPSTGVIEDSGGESSEVLGQSMTESATDTTALVEVDAQGNTYITVRLKLMDNIQDPQFQVDGKNVSATLMQEDYTNNTADYRMKVNSENSVIRCNMYVVPMGRSVIFFITVSGLHEGSGDFIASVTVDKSSNANTQQTQSSISQNNTADVNAAQASDTQSQANTDNQSSVVSNSDVNADSTVAAASDEVITSDVPAQSAAAQTTTEAAAGTTEAAATSVESVAPEKTDAKGIAEFDESGKEVDEKVSDEDESDKNKNHMVLWVVIVIAVVAAAGSAGWYFFIFKKKNTKGDAK